MKRFTSIFLGIVVVFCVLIATERTAWAYVDPGSGLLALQGLASAAATAAYLLRKRLRGWFGKDAAAQPPPFTVKPQNPHKAA